MKEVKKEYENIIIRFSIVGYRDYSDKVRFEVHQFNNDIDEGVKFLGSLTASGGGDVAEDVNGGI